MKETEYIVATNNAKLSMILHILHDILCWSSWCWFISDDYFAYYVVKEVQESVLIPA